MTAATDARSPGLANVKAVLTFIGFLEDLERSGQTVVIPGDEVERLVKRFGSRIRQMGVWNHATDGSLELSASNLAAAARAIGNAALGEALQQLKSPDEFGGVLERSGCAAIRLIDELGNLHLEQFERKVRRYQDTADAAEEHRLREEISRELFGA
jgi:hypothetical protein